MQCKMSQGKFRNIICIISLKGGGHGHFQHAFFGINSLGGAEIEYHV